jgi:PAS domain S-box-containing protein
MQTKIKISQIAAIAASALVCASILIAVWQLAELRILVLLPIAASPAIFFIYNSRLRNAERKIEDARATKALQESERRFRATFDHAGGMGLLGPKGEWVRVNRSLCQMLGYAKEELLRTTLQSISHPEDREWMGEQIANLLQGSIESVQLEQRFLRRDHEIVWVVVCLTKILKAPGEPCQANSASAEYYRSQKGRRTSDARSLARCSDRSAQPRALHGSSEESSGPLEAQRPRSFCSSVPRPGWIQRNQ